MSKRENRKKGGAHLFPSLSIFDRQTASRKRFFEERERNEHIRKYVLDRMEKKLGKSDYSKNRRKYSNVYYHIYDIMTLKRVTAETLKSINNEQINSYIDVCIEEEVRNTIRNALRNGLRILFKKKDTEREYMDFSDVRPPNPDTFFDELIVIKTYGVTDRLGITGTVELSFEDLYKQYEILVEEPTQVDTRRQGGKSRRNKKSRSKQSRKSTQKNRH